MEKTKILPDYWLSYKHEIDKFCYKKSRSIKAFENLWTKNFFDKLTYIKNITRLLRYLNYNFGNFSSIWSNEVLIFLQEICFKDISTFNTHFFTKVCLNKWKKIRIFQVYLVKSHCILSRGIDICTSSISSLPFPTRFKFWKSDQKGFSNPEIYAWSQKKLFLSNKTSLECSRNIKNGYFCILLN